MQLTSDCYILRWSVIIIAGAINATLIVAQVEDISHASISTSQAST
jgi:hypothetical protein